MSCHKNSGSGHWIFDPLGFTLVYRMLAQAVRLAGAAFLFVGIATGGTASAQTKAATVTSLSVSASGSETSSVAARTVVMLTAQVTAGGTHVSPGQVNFCDATAAYCTDIHILATAQLTSSGTATYRFRPGIGSHSYKAVFVGTNAYAGSISSSAPLTVTGTAGPFATATSIAETGAWGDYTLTGTVTEAGGTVAPTGTISFLDASNGNSVLATGSLGAASAGVGWPNPGSLSNTQGTYFVLVADLNGDGIPDLVLESNPVSIYLGKADGTYTEAATISIQQAPTSYPDVIADFNGDGIPDLAVPLYGSNDIAILLGNGNGTFAAPVLATVPGSYITIEQIVVADFNGDGIPDLAVIAAADNSTVEILLGNGDGTFTAETTNPPISGIPLNFAAGDFNGDGKADLAVTENNGTIAILLGNGDGTFTASGSVNSASSGSPSPIAVADFNGDGKLDIAVTASTNTGDSVSVLTGNGDGTFNSPFSSPSLTSTSVTWIQVADFNQDGAADVVLADSGGNVTVFLNNGSGLLSESFPVVSGLTVPYYLEVGVGDLNGDGYPDVVAGGYYNNSMGLYLTEPTETASASASVQVNGVGQHLAKASFPAERSYKSSISNSIPLWGLLPATSTTLSVTSGGSTVVSVTPETAVLLTAQVSAGTTPVTAGQVNFCDASAPHCTDIHILGSSALSSSGTATFAFVPGPGAHSYQAQFVEDGFGLASASNIALLNVGPAPKPVYSDTAAISLNGGAPGDYSIIATVTGYGGPASPTGIASFVDTSFGNNVLATAFLGTGTPGIGFLESSSPTFGSNPAGEVTADFNGDGIPDLAIISGDNPYFGGPFTVAVFLGNGDGTFRAGPTIQPSGMQLDPFMISGDFNGDGKPDLAILSWDLLSTSYLTILLSNGDGSFSAKPTVVAISQGNEGGDGIPGTMAAADFNGDGKLDLCVVGDYISTGGDGILLGNGDGTFNAATIFASDQDFGLVAVGDFNGDGIPDLVVTHYFDYGTPPTIFLGKGDGTFTGPEPASFTLAYFPTSIVVGDFNGDGIPDLAFSDLNGVEIALGNGDGTFNETSASPIQVPNELYSLQAGDFNHDGKLDLAGWDTYSGQIVLVLGAGDGTFAVKETTPGVSPSTFGIHQIAAADFNGDGVPDLAMLTYSVNTASILLTVPTETATTTVNGIAPVGTGTHNVDASYGGDSHYSAVTSSTIQLFAGLAPLVVSPPAGTYTSPQALTITEAIPGSTIYYELTGPVRTNGYVQYTGPISLPYSGVEALEAYATETGYDQTNYLSARYTLNYQTMMHATATALSSSPNPSAYGQAVTFTAVVTSSVGAPPDGEIVSFMKDTTVLGTSTLVGGSASVSISTMPAGPNWIRAVYGGDSNFDASASKLLNQVVDKATTTTALVSSLNPSDFGQPVIFTATVTPQFGGTPSGTVTFMNGSTELGTISLSFGIAGLTATKLAVGTQPITAVYNGGNSFTASTSEAVSQVVNQAVTSTTLVSSPNPSAENHAVTFTARVTAPTGGTIPGAVSFYDGTTLLGTTPLTAELIGGEARFTTTILTPGRHKITATYTGSTDFTGGSASLTQTVN